MDSDGEIWKPLKYKWNGALTAIIALFPEKNVIKYEKTGKNTPKTIRNPYLFPSSKATVRRGELGQWK